MPPGCHSHMMTLDILVQVTHPTNSWWAHCPNQMIEIKKKYIYFTIIFTLMWRHLILLNHNFVLFTDLQQLSFHGMRHVQNCDRIQSLLGLKITAEIISIMSSNYYCSVLPRLWRNGDKWPIPLKNMGTLVTFLGSLKCYIAIRNSQICGDMGPYSQNDRGHSWFQCANCPQNAASA